jgi:hypothetical protein
MKRNKKIALKIIINNALKKINLANKKLTEFIENPRVKFTITEYSLKIMKFAFCGMAIYSIIFINWKISFISIFVSYAFFKQETKLLASLTKSVQESNQKALDIWNSLGRRKRRELLRKYNS